MKRPKGRGPAERAGERSTTATAAAERLTAAAVKCGLPGVKPHGLPRGQPGPGAADTAWAGLQPATGERRRERQALQHLLPKPLN
eukprot:16446898-Heterocapsa_arctica.AAC.2